MQVNTESTRIDRLRMVVGVTLGAAGAVTLAIEGTFFVFTHLTVVFAAVLFIFAGLLIGGSHKIAQIIASLLQ